MVCSLLIHNPRVAGRRSFDHYYLLRYRWPCRVGRLLYFTLISCFSLVPQKEEHHWLRNKGNDDRFIRLERVSFPSVGSHFPRGGYIIISWTLVGHQGKEIRAIRRRIAAEKPREWPFQRQRVSIDFRGDFRLDFFQF